MTSRDGAWVGARLTGSFAVAVGMVLDLKPACCAEIAQNLSR